MLENELFLIIRFEYDGVFVETLDPARELDPTHQVNCQERFVFSSVIEERFLDILRKLFHFVFPFRFAALVQADYR